MFSAASFIPFGMRFVADSLNDLQCATSSATSNPVFVAMLANSSTIRSEEWQDYASKQSTQSTPESVSTLHARKNWHPESALTGVIVFVHVTTGIATERCLALHDSNDENCSVPSFI